MPISDDGDRATDASRTDVVIGIIARSGKVLICQRRKSGSFPGYWEFPGGKREAGETLEACLIREVREELALNVEPGVALGTTDHDYPGARIRVHPYVCSCPSGDPLLLACDAAKWVQPHDLTVYRFPPANDSFIADVIEYFNRLTRPAPTADDGR